MMLNVIFHSVSDFDAAIDFFESDISTFTVESINEEFKTLGFVVSSEDDADWTEQLLVDELGLLGLGSFHFELENHE